MNIIHILFNPWRTDRALARLIHIGESIMATVAELKSKFETLSSTVDAERVEVLAAIQALKDAIPTAPATQADLDEIGTMADALIEKVQGVITAADTSVA